MRVRHVLATGLAALTVLSLAAPAPATAASPQLRGRVTTPGGSGIPGICVDVHPAGSLASRATWVTDGSGRWSASPSVDEPSLFGPGTYRVQVAFRDCDGTANGSRAGEWWNDARSFGDAAVVTVNPSASSPVRLDATLSAGAIVTGRVVDDAGAGVSGACVRVTDPDDPSVAAEATAGTNGRYAVVGLPAGTYALRARDCAGATSQASAWLGDDGRAARDIDDAARIRLDAGDDRAVGTLVLPDAGTIRGIVQRGGTPVAGACVTAIDTASDTTFGDVTGGDGRFRITGLLPGDWIVRVDDCLEDDVRAQFATVYLLADGTNSADPSRAASDPVSVGSGTRDLGTRSVTAGGALAGRVFSDGTTVGLRPGDAERAVPGACVSAVPAGSLVIAGSDVADAEGRYAIGGLDPATAYQITAYDCGASDAHGLDWAVAAPAAGEAESYQPRAGRAVTGLDVVVGDAMRRVAGQTRVQTAVQLALDTFRTADTVILARADAYPDALAGAPLATLFDAPILLTDRTSLSPGVGEAIRSLGASRVILLGLTAALTETVEAQVEGITGVTDVRRVGGATRFDTAAQIAGFVGGTQAYVVEGSSPDPNRGWPDAVSVAGLAARTRAPLLLVERDRIPDGTRAALSQLNFAAITTIGGPVAVSEAVHDQLADHTGQLDRLFGETRYGTSAAVVQRSLQRGLWSRTTWVATGQNYPDALVAGAVVGQDGGLLQLVAGTDASQSPEALASLASLADGIERTVLLGGPVAISELSADQIRAATAGG